MLTKQEKKVAVLVPCLNEELTVGCVLKKLKLYLPNAELFVVDNGSTDNTVDLARKSGAIVLHQPLRGKGNALRLGFSKIDADIYLVIDGDDTYDPANSSQLVERMNAEEIDVLVGRRISQSSNAYPTGHKLGNLFFNYVFKVLFGGNFKDIFSGYRLVTRRFAKSFPITSSGFEIETEMSVHAIILGLNVEEVDTPYYERIEGSNSKLKTLQDGFRISLVMLYLVQKNKPLIVYGSLSFLFLSVALSFGIPVVTEYFATGLVPRFPSLIVAITFLILSGLALFTALITQFILNMQNENRRLAYLMAK